MRYFRWTLIVLAIVGAASFLHYYLPQRDIVRIVGTDTERIDAGTDPVSGGERTRLVRFINAVGPNGGTRVYRNEDTGWGWPPYGKFNSGDITARAQHLAGEADTWVAIRHYGWRIQILDMFPNVLGFREVDGPDTRLIPWFNIVFLTLLGGGLLWLWLWWRRFHARRIAPVIEDIGEGVEAVGDHAEGLWTRIRALLRRGGA
jgi:hypothetical protein